MQQIIEELQHPQMLAGPETAQAMACLVTFRLSRGADSGSLPEQRSPTLL